jgi:hypothetical protein
LVFLNKNSVVSIELEFMRDSFARLWLISSRNCKVNCKLVQKPIHKSTIVESCLQLRNFAEIAIKLPKLFKEGSKKEIPPSPLSLDLRSEKLKWPSRILQIQKPKLMIRPIKTSPFSTLSPDNQKSHFLTHYPFSGQRQEMLHQSSPFNISTTSLSNPIQHTTQAINPLSSTDWTSTLANPTQSTPIDILIKPQTQQQAQAQGLPASTTNNTEEPTSLKPKSKQSSNNFTPPPPAPSQPAPEQNTDISQNANQNDNESNSCSLLQNTSFLTGYFKPGKTTSFAKRFKPKGNRTFYPRTNPLFTNNKQIHAFNNNPKIRNSPAFPNLRYGVNKHRSLKSFKSQNQNFNFNLNLNLGKSQSQSSCVGGNKCAGCFCHYNKIIVKGPNTYRRISVNYLELAKEYENVIQYFFHQNQEIYNMITE